MVVQTSAGEAEPAPAPELKLTTSCSVAAEPFDANALLARVWNQSLPLFRERVAFLEQASLQVKAGSLQAADREEACNIAHKLAGSLGMFGYPRGTEIAQQLDAIFGAAGAPDPSLVARLTAELRASLPL